MKYIALITLLFLLASCNSSNSDGSSTPSSDSSPSKKENTGPETKTIKTLKYGYTLNTDFESIEVIELTPKNYRDLNRNDYKSLFKITVKDIASKEVKKTSIFSVVYNSQQKVKINNDVKKDFSQWESGVTDETIYRLGSVNFPNLIHALQLRKYFSLYRCRMLETQKKLMEVALGFTGDWHFYVQEASPMSAILKQQLSLIFDREAQLFIGVSFMGIDLTSNIDDNIYQKFPSLALNISPEKYYSTEVSLISRSARLGTFKRYCDQFYDETFGVSTPLGNFQKTFTPIFDEETEEKVISGEILIDNIPPAIRNNLYAEDIGLFESAHFYSLFINDNFFEFHEYPTQQINFENDPLYIQIKGEK